MHHRFFAPIGILATAVAVLSLEAITVTGQAPAPTAGQNANKATPPPTRDGRPDLQGVWDFRSATPMERPAQFADKPVLTEAEAAALTEQVLTERFENDRDNPNFKIAYDTNLWFDQGKEIRDKRSSLIINPSDGRIPPLTPQGKRRQEEEAALGKHPAAGPEDRNLSERCIVGFNAGPPMIPSFYNNSMQVFQTRDYVVILTEMIHNARLVPLTERPNVPSTVRLWQGDSRGHWEGDTLVVETANFRREGTGHLDLKPTPDGNLHVTERFTRVDRNTLRYTFTVDDPTIWTRPWTAEVNMIPSSGPIYEYACHEGNYSMTNLLSGARAEETAAAEAATSKR
jgi:hypothetical protein